MDTINQFIKNKESLILSFKKFVEILKEGEKFGVEIVGIDDKLSSIISDIKAEKIKVALVGGFSEGKTTVAAGWIGNIESNMKIDPDESSDFIHVYKPLGFENNCEIVDTPGLYGGKEFKDGGKLKDLTLKYISEAHLVLYVLDPINPIKESHSETVKWLFRDLNKIETVVFVLNKMDEISDLTDDEDFNEAIEIKRKNIIDSLKRLIDLTEDEAEKIKIVGISANPKGKGLEFWFDRKIDYELRSRINILREETNGVINNSKSRLLENTKLSVVKDLVLRQSEPTKIILTNLEFEINTRKEALEHIKNEYIRANQRIRNIIPSLREDLITYKNELVAKFNGSDLSTFQYYFDEEIGNEAINFQSRLSSIFERYLNEISGMTVSLGKSLANELDFTESLFEKHQGMLKKGVNGLKAIPTTQWHGMINSSRHFLNGTFKTTIKFKPWGITKLAKGASGIMAGVGVLLEIIEVRQKYIKEKKYEESKKEVLSLISGNIDEQLVKINDEEIFKITFAPDLIKLEENLDNIQAVYNSIRSRKDEVNVWINKLKTFSINDIEDVEFEEVKNQNH